MALKDLSPADFSYFKRYNDDMRSCHEKEFLQECDPELMRCLYRGLRKKSVNEFQEASKKAEDLVTLNRIFTATNTILPNVYNQNPRKVAIPTGTSNELSAALMTSALNYYTKVTNQKQENQDAIMNAWFFGLGWKKVGYQIQTEAGDDGPESKMSPQEKATIRLQNILGVKPDQTQAKIVPDIVRYEGLTNSSESPINVLIDHKADLRTYKVITHRLPRTLHELLTFGEYEPSILKEVEEAFTKKNGSRFDNREIELTLNEMMIEQRNGIWLLAFIDNFNKPLRYEKLTHEGSMPWSPLAVTNEPGVRYPVAHMKVASRAQAWIDNIANLNIDILGKIRNQHYINEKILNPGQKDALKRNKLGGMVFGTKTAQQGDIMPISSHGIGQDNFLMLQQFQQNATEIMGADEQRLTGKSRNKTLGQDKIAAGGTIIRESGIVDRVRDWMIDQTRKEGQYIKQYSNATLHLQITGRDFINPETGRQIEEEWVQFHTPESPLSLRHYLEGEMEYDVNVYEAIKPDNPEMRAELLEGMQVLAPLKPMFVQEGMDIEIGAMAEAYAKTFDTVDMSKFIRKLDSQQQAALQAMQVLQQNGGAVPQQLGGGEVAQEDIPPQKVGTSGK